MNDIKIEFQHHDATQPVYVFGDRVALICECEPEAWATGTVSGLQIDQWDWKWIYIVKFDKPLGFTEECSDSELVMECCLPLIQAGWEFEQRLGNFLEGLPH